MMRTGARRSQFAVALAILLASVPFRAAGQAPVPQLPSGDDPTPNSEIALLSSVESVQPGTPFTLAVHIAIDPGWHTYWINGGDAGNELFVEWSLPAGYTAGPLQWPVPQLIPAPPLMSYGYLGQVFVLVEITLPDDAPVGADAVLRGSADYEVCADICLIALQDIEVVLPVRSGPPAPDENWAATVADTRSRLPVLAEGWSLRARTNGRDGEEAAYILEIEPTGAGSIPTPGSLPEPHFLADGEFVIEHAAAQAVARVGDRIRLVVPRNYFATDYESRIGGLLVSDVRSAMPVAWWIEGPVEPGPPTSQAGDAFDVAETIMTGGVPGLGEAADAPAQESGPTMPGGMTGLAAALLFAFVGGLILNLMPCVFPVLSMKVLAFVDRGGEDPSRTRRHGLAFAAGVLACFWALAGTLLLLRAGGQSLGWGFQLQSPVIVGLLALLLFGLGLSLSGLFELGGGLTRLGSVGGGRSLGDSFLTGALTVVVATPCTAPFMGAALGFAVLQPAFVGMSVFTALALGLAAPYVVLTSAPRLLDRLPRGGAWTDTVKQALAFPMYATVVWLIWVFGNQAGMDATGLLLVGLMLLALSGWIYGGATGRSPSTVRRAAALLIVFASAALAVQGGRTGDPLAASAPPPGGVEWEAFSPERVVALRAEGQAIFIDFTADWCLSCKVNERIALHTDAVRSAFRASGLALLVADWTNRDPQIADAIEGYGRIGLPLYVLYPADPEGTPEILPAVLTPGLLIEAVERAAGT